MAGQLRTVVSLVRSWTNTSGEQQHTDISHSRCQYCCTLDVLVVCMCFSGQKCEMDH